MILSDITILASTILFFAVTIILVVVLLIAKKYLVPSGNVKITINDKTDVEVPTGDSLLSTLANQKIYLPSACGGGGSCGQCRVRIPEGGGEALPTEKVHFSRKELMDNWHLGCQVKVKNDMKLIVPESVLGVKEWECEVISNKNVATFIKEFIVALPKGEHMDFLPGSYAQIKIPKYSMDYDKDIDKSLIGDEYLPAWQKFGLFGLKCRNDEETVRAYSMANYPAEGDRIMLTVRIATPPFKPKPQVGFQDVMPGIASSYIFTLKPGDKVLMSGPYGDFHPHFNSKKEMIWVGGGAGMAPLRAQIRASCRHPVQLRGQHGPPQHRMVPQVALQPRRRHQDAPVFPCPRDADPRSDRRHGSGLDLPAGFLVPGLLPLRRPARPPIAALTDGGQP